MIVLDTNVVSGIMQAAPDRALVRWLDSRRLSDLWVTSITMMEVTLGVELLAHGRRRRQIAEAFRSLLDETLGGRVLPFERNAAEKSAEFTAQRRRDGRPIEFRDAEIAGIVAARDATLATRNVRDFANLSIAIQDPWRTAG